MKKLKIISFVLLQIAFISCITLLFIQNNNLEARIIRVRKMKTFVLNERQKKTLKNVIRLFTPSRKYNGNTPLANSFEELRHELIIFIFENRKNIRTLNKALIRIAQNTHNSNEKNMLLRLLSLIIFKN